MSIELCNTCMSYFQVQSKHRTHLDTWEGHLWRTPVNCIILGNRRNSPLDYVFCSWIVCWFVCSYIRLFADSCMGPVDRLFFRSSFIRRTRIVPNPTPISPQSHPTKFEWLHTCMLFCREANIVFTQQLTGEYFCTSRCLSDSYCRREDGKSPIGVFLWRVAQLS